MITRCRISDLSTRKTPLLCGERYLRDINMRWVLNDYFRILCPKGRDHLLNNKMILIIYQKK
uniref:Uncharacterized protein n=1 Tax=Klebsiella pneumoniae subsp. pneumoniae TaxID=72407 RepID=A0A8F7PXK9_KLEPN|nr:hypothetical protein [Klebsiella pneumoniae subsp. pneumoniae]QXV90856.1 hypothetical protein [Klebsiella pneumoniae subsp. pneumoniae]URZ92358.1 hypothetical protein [Klebsiella pneumoniae]URZ93338.1 hypothetical protein [Klebsiella pneumoniae]